MRKKIIAANWKMNKTFSEATNLLKELKSGISKLPNNKAIVVIAPPFPYLSQAVNELNGLNNVFVAAQNCYSEEQGAFTGEVSAPMLQSLGVKDVIIGHSERRNYFKEDADFLLKKTICGLKNNLTPIFCIGETLQQRESNKHFETVKNQLEETLFKLDKTSFAQVIIAYEPVWAIGTGLNATPAQAQEMHNYIRFVVSEKYGSEIAQSTSILYGGSCNEKNASELFACKDVDGGLIGGASLSATSFLEIVKQMPQ